MLIAGVDEAGRGPLAGPVTVAAVILPPDGLSGGTARLTDSKKLTASQRRELESIIRAQSLCYSVVHVSAEHIDRMNILAATLYGMQQVVRKLDQMPDKVLVDGNKTPSLSMPVEAIVGGDAKIAAISAASILAKNARDRLMCQLHQRFPQYGFDRHKGYGTRLHLEKLAEFGPCPEHRRSFAPVKRFFQARLL